MTGMASLLLPDSKRSIHPPEIPAGAAADLPCGFQCPACDVLLTIADPSTYDGRPAPCPQCAVIVIPPRIFAKPAGAAMIDLHPLPGLSARDGSRLKIPRALPRTSASLASRPKPTVLWRHSRDEGLDWSDPV
jgi:hypothetical protein